jgi:signal transduction histidine kinase
MTPTTGSSSVIPEFLYNISRITVLADSCKSALDEIISYIRGIFIFDNLAVYQVDHENHLDPFYAKAMGRGRSAEADISWGEIMASQVLLQRKTILQEPEKSRNTDRLDRPYLLGVPLQIPDRLMGVMIFIRFGSPPFTPLEVMLSEFIAQQVSMLLDRQLLQQQINGLEAQNKQAELQENFISTITHELRSPLGFIKGYTTTLLRSDMTWDQNTQQEFLNIIDQETDHLEELIENLLDSARLQSGQLSMQFQPVRLDGLLNDVIARAHLHHPEQVIYYEALSPPSTIQGDPRRLAQVFENIISNAVKYASGSPVWIKLHPDQNYLYLTISDKGPGIPEKYLNHIFQRFFRNPEQTPNVHGSGLGLFICQQIIQAHHGQIYATSQIGEGTTFHIKLPLWVSPTANPNNKKVSEVKA